MKLDMIGGQFQREKRLKLRPGATRDQGKDVYRLSLYKKRDGQSIDDYKRYHLVLVSIQ